MSKVGYICTSAMTHEIGKTEVVVYPTVEALKKDRECWKDCGIIAVDIEKVGVIEESDN